MNGSSRRSFSAGVFSFLHNVYHYGTPLNRASSGYNLRLPKFLLSRAFFISFLDNVYHYGTPLNRASSSYNLRLPKFLSSLILNFNLHGVHHVYPYLPWTRLPEFLVRQGAFYDQGYFTAAARQLRGPVPLPEIGSGRAKTVPGPESTV